MAPRNSLLVGQIALDLNLLTRDQLQQCLDFQAGQPEPRPIGALLLQSGALTETQLAQVMDEQKRRLAETTPYSTSQRMEVSFGRLLVRNGHVSQERVNEALRAQQDLADRGVRKRLGEILVEAGHLPAQVVPGILKLQGKVLMACTFCGTHLNVIQAIAEGYPCRKCTMPLSETVVSVSAEDTAYLLPPMDPRIATRRAVLPEATPAAGPVAGAGKPAAASAGSTRRLALVLLLLALIALAVLLLSKSSGG